MWHDRWAENRTGWDLNGPHPLTNELFKKSSEIAPDRVKGRWLIPGCGRGHDGPRLLALGASSVEGRDLVPLAIDEAKRLYSDVPHLTFRCSDVTELSSQDQAAFDCIFDRAMLCALSGEMRQNYVRACLKYLKNDGLFASLAFASTFEPEIAPPFQIKDTEIRHLFGSGWNIECMEERRDGACGQKILSEWLLIVRKL